MRGCAECRSPRRAGSDLRTTSERHMSTDMYLACDKHKSCIHVAQTGLSGFTFYSGEPDCMSALGKWLREHYLCEPGKVYLTTEHHTDEDDGWARAEW